MHKVSVSPIADTAGDGDIGGGAQEGSDVEGEGEMGERLRLPEEDAFVRKVRDPRLPTREDVESHNMRGHIPYRNWCPACV